MFNVWSICVYLSILKSNSNDQDKPFLQLEMRYTMNSIELPEFMNRKF